MTAQSLPLPLLLLLLLLLLGAEVHGTDQQGERSPWGDVLLQQGTYGRYVAQHVLTVVPWQANRKRHRGEDFVRGKEAYGVCECGLCACVCEYVVWLHKHDKHKHTGVLQGSSRLPSRGLG